MAGNERGFRVGWEHIRMILGPNYDENTYLSEVSRSKSYFLGLNYDVSEPPGVSICVFIIIWMFFRRSHGLWAP